MRSNAVTVPSVSDSFQCLHQLDGEEDSNRLHGADDDGDGSDEDKMISGKLGQFVSTSRVVNIARMVSHTTHSGYWLATRVWNLEVDKIKHPSQKLLIAKTLLLYRMSDLHHDECLQSSNPSAPQHLKVDCKSSTAAVVWLKSSTPYSSLMDLFKLKTNSLWTYHVKSN